LYNFTFQFNRDLPQNWIPLKEWRFRRSGNRGRQQMSIQSFTDYLDGQALTSQGVFAKNYTAWLDNVVLGNSDVQTWLLHSQLDANQSAAFLTGQWHIDLEQNSESAAPTIVFSDNTITPFSLDPLFAADLADEKESFTPAHGQERFYVDQAVVPPALFAVAFTDTNGDHKYEEGTDKLIAAVVDANHDGTLDAGDKIEWGTYPTSLGDGSGPRGTFTSPDTDILGVQPFNGFQLTLNTASGQIFFSDTPTGQAFLVPHAQLGDAGFGSPFFTTDFIVVDPSFHGAGLPNVPVNLIDDTATAAGNQAFLDTQFFF
jgi:hypothetical protein